MSKTRYGVLIAQLFSIRNLYGKKYAAQKINYLSALSDTPGVKKNEAKDLNSLLYFILAYPDNHSIYNQALISLQKLQLYIAGNTRLKDSLYNSGITNTQLCASYSFEIIKWLRNRFKYNVRLISFDANDSEIQSILSVVMPKVESEILQDGNAEWRTWLKMGLKVDGDLLDRLIVVFENGDMRPEVKDELWSAMGLNVEIDFKSIDKLPDALVKPYFHHALLKKKTYKISNELKFERFYFRNDIADQIIDCSRMVLLKHLREIDPITFTAAEFISYFQLPRGLSVVLMGMVPERRHPIDSYMGYVVFKNGLPVAYAGSWVLFDSARIGLNIFPAYRGGESQYIFDQVLRLHKHVYNLNRFTVDPYQVGKDNKDGIHSGAFWFYYQLGFRPLKEEQKLLALEEARKIKLKPRYRTPEPVLKRLADSRLELVLKKNAVNFDATDLSRIFVNLIDNNQNKGQNISKVLASKNLVNILGFKNISDNLMYIIKNWAVLLLSADNNLSTNEWLKKQVKNLFELKAFGKEEDYIKFMQESADLRKSIQLLNRKLQ